MIDLGDDMVFERLPGATRDELSCNVADVPTDDSNLVIKARKWLLAARCAGRRALVVWGALAAIAP